MEKTDERVHVHWNYEDGKDMCNIGKVFVGFLLRESLEIDSNLREDAQDERLCLE